MIDRSRNGMSMSAPLRDFGFSPDVECDVHADALHRDVRAVCQPRG
ncbi:MULTISPECIES: hypothetical protein [Burkholderia]|nr:MULTISPECIES: hypothetical protein [Burkholderia]